jgi:type VI secretion system protein ImpF
MALLGDRRVISSLFDRLTDDVPFNSREVPAPEWDQIRKYKDSVARDLTSLLNTRRRESDIPEQFEHTRKSLAAYGVQDFTTAPLDREMIRRAIERAVRLFEPRLIRMQVSAEDGSDFKLSFRISGMLRVSVGVEPVAYNADLPTETRRFRVAPTR